jgi:hypothetical protein
MKEDASPAPGDAIRQARLPGAPRLILRTIAVAVIIGWLAFCLVHVLLRPSDVVNVAFAQLMIEKPTLMLVLVLLISATGFHAAGLALSPPMTRTSTLVAYVTLAFDVVALWAAHRFFTFLAAGLSINQHAAPSWF